MITGAGALAGGIALTVTVVPSGPGQSGVLLLGVAAVVLLGLGLVRGDTLVLTAAVLLLAGQMMLAVLTRGAPASVTVAVYGAALLVIAELAHWSVRLQAPLAGTRGVWVRQGVAIAGLGAVALAVGVVLAQLADVAVPGGLLLLAAGVGAVLAAFIVVLLLVWPAGHGATDQAASLDPPATGPVDRP